MTLADSAGTLTIAGRTVPRLGFGTMRLTGPNIVGENADRDECVRVVRAAYDGGVRLFDTAWFYGPDTASTVVRDALFPYADDVLFVSKLGAARNDAGDWIPGSSPEQLRAGAERECRLLGVDHLPVVHLRLPHGGGVFDEMLETFIALQADGLVGEIGLSTIGVAELEKATAAGVSVATVSNPYGPGNTADQPVLDWCTAHGVPFLPYFAVIGAHADDGINQVAQETGATAQQVSIAWQLQTSPVMVPIPGTSKVAHLTENLAAADLRLTDEQLATIG